MKSILIIGSGLAGMSAAVYLADKGHRVTVLESLPFIGGRTSSWVQDGMEIESGLHRFLGFYSALPELIGHVGADIDKIVTWEDEVEVRDPKSTFATLGLAPLHRPFKTIWNVLGHNNFIPLSDKLALAKMFAAGLRAHAHEPKELDKITVADYAKQHGVSQQVIDSLLTALTDGIFFVPVHEYSTYNFMGLISPYLKSIHRLRVGAFNGGMTKILMAPLAEYVIKHGGTILTNQRVRELMVKNGDVTGARSHDRSFEADETVLAASLLPAQKLLALSFPDEVAFAPMQQLGTTPSVTFQIDLASPSMDQDRTTFGPGTIMAAFTEQSRTTFPGPGRISIILSQAEKYATVPAEAILNDIIATCEILRVKVRDNVKRYRKVVIPHDFYNLRTGNEHLRPNQITPIPHLYLAGDYTNQPYLATMEGAVVSGKIVAEAAG